MKKLFPILFLWSIVFYLCACGPNYSNGTRTGVITKLSEKGLIFKSWEGEMLVALPSSVASATQPEKFEFNVSPECVEKVKAALDSNRRVEVVYRQWAVSPFSIENDHVIVDVKYTDGKQ